MEGKQGRERGGDSAGISQKEHEDPGTWGLPSMSPLERLCDLNLFEPLIPRDLHKVTEQASRRRAANWTCA